MTSSVMTVMPIIVENSLIPVKWCVSSSSVSLGLTSAELEDARIPDEAAVSLGFSAVVDAAILRAKPGYWQAMAGDEGNKPKKKKKGKKRVMPYDVLADTMHIKAIKV